jgi:hypothetical protein
MAAEEAGAAKDRHQTLVVDRSRHSRTCLACRREPPSARSRVSYRLVGRLYRRFPVAEADAIDKVRARP